MHPIRQDDMGLAIRMLISLQTTLAYLALNTKLRHPPNSRSELSAFSRAYTALKGFIALVSTVHGTGLLEINILRGRRGVTKKYAFDNIDNS